MAGLLSLLLTTISQHSKQGLAQAWYSRNVCKMSDLRFTPLVEKRWTIAQNYITFAPHREHVLEILQIGSPEPVWLAPI